MGALRRGVVFWDKTGESRVMSGKQIDVSQLRNAVNEDYVRGPNVPMREPAIMEYLKSSAQPDCYLGATQRGKAAALSATMNFIL